MPSGKSYLFVSYARTDLDHVRPIVDMVRREIERRALPVGVWADVSNLQPGEQWDVAIEEALKASIGFLFLVSSRSLQSDWVRRELEIAAAVSGRLIIPVLLEWPLDLPPALAARNWLDLSGDQSPKQIMAAARRIADATESFLKTTPRPKPAVSMAEAPALAVQIAQQVRDSTTTPTAQENLSSVFLVHGHNTEVLAKLESYLASVGITAVVLSRQEESPQSLFQKFMSVATKSRFAIVLLCADDYGASRRQYEAPKVADRALQFRARQNVILELGFFYGRLGWENVFVVYQEPDIVFPNFERPSDLDGVVFESISDAEWHRKLGAKLAAAGFKLLLPS